MVLAIRGVSNYFKTLHLSNYSLTIQIIIINLLTAIFAFVFLFLFNYYLLLSDKNLDIQSEKIKNNLYDITNYLSDQAVKRIPEFHVKSCLISKDHQIVIAPKCLEDNRKTYEKKLFSETSDLQLDPTFTQEYILDNYINKDNSIKVYDDTWIKFVDTQDIYISDEVVEVDLEKNILESANNTNLYIQYRNFYLKYFNYFQQYFDRAKIGSRISEYKKDILLVKETIMKQSNLFYVYEDDSTNIVMVNSAPVLKNDNIYGVVLVSGILSQENEKSGLISFNLFNMFVIIILIMFLLSLLFLRSIITPIKTLSKITRMERDKSIKKNSSIIYPQRNDEIGILSDDIRGMSVDLKKRINEIESFAADVSHELKNPLTSIKNSNELLLGDKINDDKKNLLLANMQKDIERINTLITDISSYTLTQIEIDDEFFYYFDLIDFLQDFLQSYASNSKDIKITFEHEKRPCKIYANKDKLAQVFINIIDNSLSYSPVQATILLKQKIDNNQVVIYLADQGSGISDNLSEKIFERFYTDRPLEQNKHSGLGLSIAKKIVNSFFGSIKLSNVKFKGYLGACFEIILPLKE